MFSVNLLDLPAAKQGGHAGDHTAALRGAGPREPSQMESSLAERVHCMQMSSIAVTLTGSYIMSQRQDANGVPTEMLMSDHCQLLPAHH